MAAHPIENKLSNWYKKQNPDIKGPLNPEEQKSRVYEQTDAKDTLVTKPIQQDIMKKYNRMKRMSLFQGDLEEISPWEQEHIQQEISNVRALLTKLDINLDGQFNSMEFILLNHILDSSTNVEEALNMLQNIKKKYLGRLMETEIYNTLRKDPLQTQFTPKDIAAFDDELIHILNLFGIKDKDAAQAFNAFNDKYFNGKIDSRYSYQSLLLLNFIFASTPPEPGYSIQKSTEGAPGSLSLSSTTYQPDDYIKKSSALSMIKSTLQRLKIYGTDVDKLNVSLRRQNLLEINVETLYAQLISESSREIAAVSISGALGLMQVKPWAIQIIAQGDYIPEALCSVDEIETLNAFKQMKIIKGLKNLPDPDDPDIKYPFIFKVGYAEVVIENKTDIEELKKHTQSSDAFGDHIEAYVLKRMNRPESVYNICLKPDFNILMGISYLIHEYNGDYRPYHGGRMKKQQAYVRKIQRHRTLQFPDRYPEYRVARGDTFDGIAERFSLDRKTLAGYNPHIKDISSIKPGDRIYVSQQQTLLASNKNGINASSHQEKGERNERIELALNKNPHNTVRTWVKEQFQDELNRNPQLLHQVEVWASRLSKEALRYDGIDPRKDAGKLPANYKLKVRIPKNFNLST